MSRLVALSLVLAATLALAPAAFGATRLVDTTGVDAGNCTGSPCQTIQYAVDQAGAGDTVSVAAGTYAETVTVNTPVTLNGAEAGVDGRGRPLTAGSTRLQGGLVLQADTTVDGFYIDTPPVHGIRVTSGTATIRNTVFFHAANALYVSSPASNLLVERNDFSDTVPAGLNDYAIFAHAGVPLAVVTIRDNAFAGYDNAGGAGGSSINIGNAPGLLVERNTDTNSGSFLVLTDTSGATIRDNVGDTFSGSALYLGKGNANVTIQGNRLSNGATRGIRFGADFGTGASTGYQILGNQITGFPYGLLVADGAVGDTIEVHGNRIVGNTTAGIQDDRAGGADVDASANWWGCNGGAGSAGCDSVVATNGGTIDTSSPLQFGGLSATPSPYYTQHDYTVTAQVGAPEPLADGWPVAFATTSGTIDTPEDTLDGAVTTTWTADATGPRMLHATLDNETLQLNVTVLSDAPPETIIDTRPPNVSNAPITNATWTFHATDVADPAGPFTYECQLDGGGWSACTSPYVVANLGEGDHTFEVRATDPFGHTDATQASDSVLVDLTKPTITVNVPPVRSQDGSENVLPTYLYESNPAEDITCADPLVGSPPGASGVANCDQPQIDTSTLGVHGMTITAVDNAGNAADPVYRTYRVHPPRYGDYVNADSPRVYWRMDDPKGSTTTTNGGTYHTNVADKRVVLRRDPAISCEGRPPAPHRPQGCEITDDPQGYSAFFPGDNGAYVSVDGGLSTTPSYTMEAWIKPVGTADGGIMDHGVNNGALFIRGGKIVFHAQDVEITGPAVTPGVWTQVAGTFGSGTARLFVNGVQVGTASTSTLPSGSGTAFYVGRTDHAIAPKAFHGYIDEAAYYPSVVSAHRLWSHWHIGTYQETAGPAIPPFADMHRPTIDTRTPANGALYSLTSSKTPLADFSCADIEDPAPTCAATVDGTPINDGDPLPQTAGEHVFTVVATDASGLHYTHSHRYYVESFRDLIAGAEPWALPKDVPTLYYRFDEPSSATTALSQTGYPATYKNDPVNGPTGISGDGNTTRTFLGRGGYAFVPSVPSAPDGFSFEAWVRPADGGDMGIFDHGGTGGGPSVWIQGGQVRFRMPDGSTVSAPRPALGAFFQVHARWDGVTMSLWIDGVKQAEAETTKAPSGSPSLYVGMVNGLGLAQPWFRGEIDEVSYYAAPLRDTRVFDHWFADPPAPAAAGGGGSTPPSGGGGGGGGGGGLGGGFGGGGGGSSAASTSTPTTSTPPAVTGPATSTPPTTTTAPATTTKKKTKKTVVCSKKKTKKQRSACYAAKRKAAEKAKGKGRKG